jgi:hypothetical protein
MRPLAFFHDSDDEFRTKVIMMQRNLKDACFLVNTNSCREKVSGFLAMG